MAKDGAEAGEFGGSKSIVEAMSMSRSLSTRNANIEELKWCNVLVLMKV